MSESSNTGKQTVRYGSVMGKVVYVNTDRVQAHERVIFKIHAETSDKYYRCICNDFFPIKEGDAIFGVCRIENDKRYGDQLIFDQAPFATIYADRNALRTNMMAGLRLKGFGPKKVDMVIDHMVDKYHTIDRAINTVDGVSTDWSNGKRDEDIMDKFGPVLDYKNTDYFLKWWYKNRVLRRLYLLGLNNREIRDSGIRPEDLYTTCLKNPYKVANISMEKCENIMKITQQPVSPELKVCGEIIRRINHLMTNNGYCGMPTNMLIKSFKLTPAIIDIIKNNFDVKVDLNTAYLEHGYQVENWIANKVLEINNGPPIGYVLSPDNISFTDYRLSDDQRAAITGALTNNISIITGSAGSGKTTCISQLIRNLDNNNIDYVIVSFTGKAVSRIKEVVTSSSPATMHRLISENRPMKFKHLIIDEAFMVTTPLLYDFMEIYAHEYKITLIGDKHQLPPIGWGQLSQQLIVCDRIPTFRLTKVHRTDNKDTNGILSNANKIIEYAVTDPDQMAEPFGFDLTSNFVYFPGDKSMVNVLISSLVAKGLSCRDITIITPFNADVYALNMSCQMIYNGIDLDPEADSYEADRLQAQKQMKQDEQACKCTTDCRGYRWYIGDRVMMTKNNYAVEVMNGEEGIITAIDKNNITVKFHSGRSLDFKTDESSAMEANSTFEKYMATKKDVVYTDVLTHSFAISIHKSQGSEWDVVVIYVPEAKQTSRFVNRNLLYTAITRAKKMVWCVGDIDTMTRGATMPPPYCHDNLCRRINKLMTVTVGDGYGDDGGDGGDGDDS